METTIVIRKEATYYELPVCMSLAVYRPEHIWSKEAQPASSKQKWWFRTILRRINPTDSMRRQHVLLGLDDLSLIVILRPNTDAQPNIEEQVGVNMIEESPTQQLLRTQGNSLDPTAECPSYPNPPARHSIGLRGRPGVSSAA